MFEGGPEFLQTVAVATGGGVGGEVEQFGDGVEGEVMPDLEHDDLALVVGEAMECVDGGAFDRGFAGVGFEPAGGFEFAGEPAPEGSAVVEGAITEAAEEIEPGFAGGYGQLQEGGEGVMEHVFGLGMAESQGASVEDDLGGAGIVEICRPLLLLVHAAGHCTH